LPVVAILGNAGGLLAHFFDARHRRVTRRNLRIAFPEKPEREIRSIVRRNFRRIGENYGCAIKTASMSFEQILRVCPVIGAEKLRSPTDPLINRIVAIGHFGNFEIYTILSRFAPGYRGATTYRALRQPGLNRLLQELRSGSGCLCFERRTEAKELLRALNDRGLIIGILSDQHAGNKGVWGPLFGAECSTTPAPAVFALRYDSPLNTAIIYRVALGRWQIEVGDEIPPRDAAGKPRSVDEIMGDVNRVFEAAIRRDPANWFWVHKRWKPRPPVRQNETAPVHEVMD
jgi:lauroyl/myristoyl acyltransferase